MHNMRFGEICELSYLQSSGPCLPHLVRELSDRLLTLGLKSVKLTWDCDDIAIIEIPKHRIVLAIADAPSPGVAKKLLISVGPCTTDDDEGSIEMGHSALCRRIARAIERKHPSDKRQTRSWPGVLLAERVDDLLYSNNAPTQQSDVQREFVAPKTSAVMAQDQMLRRVLVACRIWQRRRLMAAGLLINAMTWSLAPVAPVIVLAIFGANVISTLMWSSSIQLPR